MRRQKLLAERRAEAAAHGDHVREKYENHLLIRFEKEGNVELMRMIEARHTRKELRRTAEQREARIRMFITHSVLLTCSGNWFAVARAEADRREHERWLHDATMRIQEAWRTRVRQQLWRRIAQFLATIKSSPTAGSRMCLHLRCWKRGFSQKVLVRFLRVFIKVGPMCVD